MRFIARASSAFITISTIAVLASACAQGKAPDEAVTTSRAALGALAPNTVLILDSSVLGGAMSNEATQAAASGYNVEIATAADWLAKTTTEFQSYRAIVLGDGACGNPSNIAVALSNRSVWSPAVTGNMIIAGNDPVSHVFNGSNLFTRDAIRFAADASGSTGAYISLSCYYAVSSPPGTAVDVLDQFGTFTVGQATACYNDAHKVAIHPTLDLITDIRLSNWNCSVRETFDGFPSSFIPLAIAEGASGPGWLSLPDTSNGLPYILARGATLSRCGDGEINDDEACDDGNHLNGDACTEACQLYVPMCGNAVLDAGEECDDGNDTSGDGCSATCLFENVTPSIGACCLNNGGCAEAMTEADCAPLGWYTADGLTCSLVGPECPQQYGACCLHDGTCVDNVTPNECGKNKGASFLGFSTTCDDPGLSCEPPHELPGACCLGESCAELTATQCAAANGTFAGPGMPCGEDSCPGCTTPVGACCVEEQCLVLSQADCFSNGGLYAGDGVPCVEGACACASHACSLSEAFPRDGGGAPYGIAALGALGVVIARRRRARTQPCGGEPRG